MALILSARAGIDGPFHILDGDKEILKIEAIKISGNQVSLSFVADDNIIIHRDIVYNRIQAEKGGNR
jgi:sRNA-binding carbon storage regulator CsrA